MRNNNSPKITSISNYIADLSPLPAPRPHKENGSQTPQNGGLIGIKNWGFMPEFILPPTFNFYFLRLWFCETYTTQHLLTTEEVGHLRK